MYLLNNIIKKKLVKRANLGHGSLIGQLYRETDTVLEKTVDTHKILINAIKFYVYLQEI